MSVDGLLARLVAVRRTGADRWIARCPAHTDKRPSLAVRELDDGRVLAHCHAGCSIDEVVAAVGLGLEDLYPPTPRAPHAVKGTRRPFNAHDVLRCVAFEVTVARLCSAAMRAGEALSDEDDARLGVAMSRLMAAEELAHGR